MKTNRLDWSRDELLTLTEAASLLAAHTTRTSLYVRARSGRLYAVRIGRRWWIPRAEAKRLLRQAENNLPLPISSRLIDSPSESDIERIAALPIAKRGRAALEAQAFLRGTIRARLRRMYPKLSAREITLKYFEEVELNG